MVNLIWGCFILIGIITFLVNGDLETLNSEILNSTKESLDMMMKIFPVMALWLGIMKIASTSGLLKKLSDFVSPLLRIIFPEIPKGHESFSYLASNMIANMFGLGNAATPFGLKAMKSLQTLNEKKDTATRSMITFLVINTSGVTIVPTTIISLRMMHGSSNPTEVVLACILATTSSTVAAIFIDRFYARKEKKKCK